MVDEQLMREALRLAENAAHQDEVPIGALLVKDGLRLGTGFNRNIGDADATAHAEIVAIREACRYQNNYRLTGCTLYVTLEPCPMCFTAMIHARVATLVYGADDPKGGFRKFFSDADLEQFNHRIEIVSGVLAEESSNRIRAFFKQKRERGKRKWMRER